MNIKLIKKILTEKKTTLPSLKNKDYKNVKVETEKLNNVWANISTSNITELDKLIYAGTEWVWQNLCFP